MLVGASNHLLIIRLITCLTAEIIEGINFRCLNAIGVWYVDCSFSK